MDERPNDAVREAVHGMWAGVAGQWGDHADGVDHRTRHQAEWLLAKAGVSPGQRVLELACGPGGPGLAAAEVVGSDGEVVLSDQAQTMVAVAAARAAARGLTNVSTAVLDLEAVDQPDASYDAVLCRDGLMFALEPARGVAEVFRLLRPGGRAALSVWGPPADNPWLGALLDAASDVLGMPVPPPGVPGPFSLADADLRGLLEGAGFEDVVVEEVSVPQQSPSFEAYWDFVTALAGPLAVLLQGVDDGSRQAIRDRTREALARYTSDDGLDIPGVSRMVSGRKG